MKKTILALVAVVASIGAVACSGAPADGSSEPVGATQNAVSIERTADAFDANHAVRSEFYATCTPDEIASCRRRFPDGATCVIYNGRPLCEPW
jgi:hypothetical protein